MHIRYTITSTRFIRLIHTKTHSIMVIYNDVKIIFIFSNACKHFLTIFAIIWNCEDCSFFNNSVNYLFLAVFMTVYTYKLHVMLIYSRIYLSMLPRIRRLEKVGIYELFILERYRHISTASNQCHIFVGKHLICIILSNIYSVYEIYFYYMYANTKLQKLKTCNTISTLCVKGNYRHLL